MDKDSELAQIQHTPRGWKEELQWIMKKCNGKGWRAQVLKCAFNEIVYESWNYRNSKSFGDIDTNINIENNIIDSIVFRTWSNPKMRHHIAKLMMP